jgi:hypothetical protein
MRSPLGLVVASASELRFFSIALSSKSSGCKSFSGIGSGVGRLEELDSIVMFSILPQQIQFNICFIRNCTKSKMFDAPEKG